MDTTEGMSEKEYTNQNDLGFIKFLLYSHDIIRMSWVLVLLKKAVDLWERNRGRFREGRLRNFSCEIIKELGEKGESRSDRIFLVSDNHSYITRRGVSTLCIGAVESES